MKGKDHVASENRRTGKFSRSYYEGKPGKHEFMAQKENQVSENVGVKHKEYSMRPILVQFRLFL